jgi:hypothetical protein
MTRLDQPPLMDIDRLERPKLVPNLFLLMAWPLAQQHRHAELARATAKRERYQRHPHPDRPPRFEVANLPLPPSKA